MKMLWRRRVLAAALSLTAAVGGLLVAGTAHAQTVATGSLSFNGDSGDYISQGKSYSYSTSNGDALTVSSSTGSTVSISVNAYNGDWWTLTFDAPGTQVLVPRTYTAAHRHPFNGTGPGLDLSGEGRGCNELTGSFTIIKAVFGPRGYVQTFDATFEQHCEGGDPAARGEIHISNRPPPPEVAPKPAATTRPHAATTRPDATPSSRPSATPSSRPSATPSSRPSATPSSRPSATAVGSGNTSANDTDANTAAVVRNAVFSPLLLIGVGLVALAGLVAVGLAVGLVIYVRRQ
ncbi:hypothetical protein [Micromonospora cremea]|uniref:Uncharacterized protein n=1 Tax=Micromonospora cremea TaxID=709881 RepID=A0A1N5YQW3_9ACTN|nr:hypothetical protein [Micromonospora cremea]SIN12006.1 hypothetical protein SAMN04489832_3162 [Micromonospora cremea]